MLYATFLQKIPTGILAIIVPLLAYQLALLTWAFVPTDKSALLWNPVVATSNLETNTINTRQLQQQHLFGEKDKDKEAQRVVKKASVDNAPKTRLNLTLVGIVASSEPQHSSAIIDHKGRQGSYFIDSKIEGTGAVITTIYEDRIILSVNGVDQTLMLDGVEILDEQHQSHERKSHTSVQSKPQQSMKNAKVKTINLNRQELLKNPGKLTDYIRISPVRQNGKVKGYRIKPGKDRTLFEQAGLKNGDLAVELNGVDLTDTQQAFTLMRAFPTMTDMTLSVERDGQLHELYFSIP